MAPGLLHPAGPGQAAAHLSLPAHSHPGCAGLTSVCCSNLYDVFDNIRKDEEEHVKTMTACRDYSIVQDLIQVLL